MEERKRETGLGLGQVFILLAAVGASVLICSVMIALLNRMGSFLLGF
jgi:hypothetical protein